MLQAFPELRRLGLELGVGHGFVLVGQGLHLVHNGVNGFQLPGAGISEDTFQKTHILNILSDQE